MIKRTTAIVFILLANLILLAHAVVPHHHHKKQVCLTNSHCINELYAYDNGTNHDSHSHDGESNSEDCFLKVPIVISSNQWKVDFKLYNTSDNSGLDDFHYNLFNNSAKLLIPVFSSFYYEQFPDNSYTIFVSASLGLRAPPVV